MRCAGTAGAVGNLFGALAVGIPPNRLAWIARAGAVRAPKSSLTAEKGTRPPGHLIEFHALAGLHGNADRL
jgi:hypothetical protein